MNTLFQGDVMYKDKIYILSAFEMERLQQKLFDAYLKIAESLDNDYFSIEIDKDTDIVRPSKTISTQDLEALF